MKDLIIAILAGLLALARTPIKEKKSIKAQKENLQLQRDELDTLHGDEDLNSDEAKQLLDDLTEVLATSEPDGEYAEVPKLEEAEEESDDEEESSDETAEEESSDETEEEEESTDEESSDEEETEEESEPEETPRQKRLREKQEKLDAEEAEAAKAVAKKKATAVKKRK